MRWGSQSFRDRSSQPGSRRMRLGQDPLGIFRQDTKDIWFEMWHFGTNPGDKGCGPCLQGSCILFHRAGRENLDSKVAYHRCYKFQRHTLRFLLRCIRILRDALSQKLNLFMRLCFENSPAGHELHILAPAGEISPLGHCLQDFICVSSSLEYQPGPHCMQSSAELCRMSSSPSSSNFVPGLHSWQERCSDAFMAWSALYLPAGERQKEVGN